MTAYLYPDCPTCGRQAEVEVPFSAGRGPGVGCDIAMGTPVVNAECAHTAAIEAYLATERGQLRMMTVAQEAAR